MDPVSSQSTSGSPQKAKSSSFLTLPTVVLFVLGLIVGFVAGGLILMSSVQKTKSAEVSDVFKNPLFTRVYADIDGIVTARDGDVITVKKDDGESIKINVVRNPLEATGSAEATLSSLPNYDKVTISKRVYGQVYIEWSPDGKYNFSSTFIAPREE
ncbi:MAG TPA: hypothetical protein VLE91_04110 [Candidatus Saccharimonadales bacterium]|nr:hypothetical protein [Candidatus Saccharimonadales bacterium]